MVQGCTHTKQTFSTEDEFTVTTSPGIWNRDVRVPEIVVRELENQTRQVGMREGSRSLVTTGEETGVFWTLLTA